jgi:hypothetical protein
MSSKKCQRQNRGVKTMVRAAVQAEPSVKTKYMTTNKINIPYSAAPQGKWLR